MVVKVWLIVHEHASANTCRHESVENNSPWARYTAHNISGISFDFGYFHPPKEFSNGQNILLLSKDPGICTLMLISIEAQDAKQTREKHAYP